MILAILIFPIPSNLNAIELRDKYDTKGCSINDNIPLLTNHGTFTYKSNMNDLTDGIYFQGIIDLFVNYGTITTYYQDKLTTHSFSFVSKTEAGFNALINYGTLAGGVSGNDNKSIHITNYGVMGGVDSGDITLTNYGVIKPLNGGGTKYHFGKTNLTLQTSLMKINESASKFNSFDGNAEDNSHLVVDNVQSVKFADSESRLILDFDFESDFELGAGYLFDKLVVDTSGKNVLNVDLSRLIPKSDIFYITQQGEHFVVNIAPQYSTIGNLYKSNVRTMNNFYTMSNSMIYPRKYAKSQNLRKSSLRDLPTANRGNPKDLRAKRSNHLLIDSALDSAR